MRHYIIPNWSDVIRISILQSLDIYNRIQRLPLQRVEASGEPRRPAESKRTPFQEIAGNLRLMQFLGSYSDWNRRERACSRVIEEEQVSGLGGYAPPNFRGWGYPLHCGIWKWRKETNLRIGTVTAFRVRCFSMAGFSRRCFQWMQERKE